MRYALLAFVSLGSMLATAATPPANFTGDWKFDPSQSKNVGMMAQASIVTAITQSPLQIVVDDTSVFNGQKDIQHTLYDLRGKPVSNMSIMAGAATTSSHWDGGRLITEWQSAGAIAGTVNKRVETRYLSADGKTMYVESARAGKEPVLVVFTKAR